MIQPKTPCSARQDSAPCARCRRDDARELRQPLPWNLVVDAAGNLLCENITLWQFHLSLQRPAVSVDIGLVFDLSLVRKSL